MQDFLDKFFSEIARRRSPIAQGSGTGDQGSGIRDQGLGIRDYSLPPSPIAECLLPIPPLTRGGGQRSGGGVACRRVHVRNKAADSAAAWGLPFRHKRPPYGSCCRIPIALSERPLICLAALGTFPPRGEGSAGALASCPHRGFVDLLLPIACCLLPNTPGGGLSPSRRRR